MSEAEIRQYQNEIVEEYLKDKLNIEFEVYGGTGFQHKMLKVKLMLGNTVISWDEIRADKLHN